MTEIIIPDDMWDDDSEGFISTWFFKSGETVKEGDVIAEVMNEKVAAELVAPTAGELTVLVEAEQPFTKGKTVGRVG